ncbi:MAG: CHRD domain-containing protein [Acidimicrobiaceae bacterium]|nr:CHRD domain-containing protein [Acidimicrobiaceae bacterium]
MSGAAGLVVLGVGGGAALAAGGNSSPLNVQTASAAQSLMNQGMSGQSMTSASHTGMPTDPMSGPASSYKTSVNLDAMPAGTVTFQQQGSMLQATIDAFGLTPGSSHIAEITNGRDQAPIDFSQFTASATGQVDATISSLTPVGALSRDASFQVELSTSPDQPIAVAPVNLRSMGYGREMDNAVPLHAIEASSPDRLAGHATLNYDSKAQTLTVRVDATGFVPDTTHAAHIHEGSCMSQGAPILMLPDLQADRHGRVDQTDVIKNLATFTAPANGWYINIHEGSSATILDAQGNPTVQFRPLLCANLPATTHSGFGQGGNGNGQGNPQQGYQPQGNQPMPSRSTSAPSPSSQTPATDPSMMSQPSSPSSPTTDMTPPTTAPSSTAPPAPTTTVPASGNSGTTPATQEKDLNVSFIPNGSLSGTAVVTLQPADNQISVTANLSGFDQSSLSAQIVTDDNDTVVSFSLNAASPGPSFQGTTQLSPSVLKEMGLIPGAYKLRVSVGGNSPQFLLGTLHP